MSEQERVNVEYHLQYCENKLSIIGCNGSLATNNNIEELVEAMRQLILAIRQIP